MKRISGEQAEPSQGTLMPVPSTKQTATPLHPHGLYPPSPLLPYPHNQTAHKGTGCRQYAVPLGGRPIYRCRPAGDRALPPNLGPRGLPRSEGRMDRERGFDFWEKGWYNNVAWKKPLEILKDHDEDGLRSIFSTIGQKRVLEFLKQEGVNPSGRLSAEDIILGRGYTDRPGKTGLPLQQERKAGMRRSLPLLPWRIWASLRADRASR